MLGSALDIPIRSSINLFSKVPNKRGILRGKDVSEGPMCLANSVFFAIKNAIRDARRQLGLNGQFNFNPPATPASIKSISNM